MKNIICTLYFSKKAPPEQTVNLVDFLEAHIGPYYDRVQSISAQVLYHLAVPFRNNIVSITLICIVCCATNRVGIPR